MTLEIKKLKEICEIFHKPMVNTSRKKEKHFGDL